MSDLIESMEANALRDLLVEWRDTQHDIASLMERELNGSSATDGSAIDAQLEAIGQEQSQLVVRISEHRATSHEAIVAKLKVWTDLIGPQPNSDDWAQPSDRLVYSVLEDLCA